MRILKKFLLFTTELSILFFGFIFSAGLTAFLHDAGYRFPLLAFLVALALVSLSFVSFRKKTGRWTTEADAAAWIKYRSWEKQHPCTAKYLRFVQFTFLLFPTLCATLVLFFLPVVSHVVYSGASRIPHYRVSTPLNWLIIKAWDETFIWTFFSNQGASRYGFTPLLFNYRMPSGCTFSSSDPKQTDGWWLPNHELTTGRTTHVGVRKFQIGSLSATCYEYQHTYGNVSEYSPSILNRPVLWESLCSTQPNGVQYNLRASFFGDREDLPDFYEVLKSATPTN